MLYFENRFAIGGIVEAGEYAASGMARAVITLCSPHFLTEVDNFPEIKNHPEKRAEFLQYAALLMQILGTGEIPHLRSQLFHADTVDGHKRHLGGPPERILREANAITNFANTHLALTGQPNDSETMPDSRLLVFHCIEGLNRSPFALLIAIHSLIKADRENDATQSFAQSLAILHRKRPEAMVHISNREYFDVIFGYGAFEEMGHYQNTMYELRRLKAAALSMGIRSVRVLLKAQKTSIPEPLRKLVTDELIASCHRYEIIPPPKVA